MIARTVSRFAEDPTDPEDQHYATFADPRYGRTTVWGWVTSDGVVIFTRDVPKFCPKTGKPLTRK